MDDLEERYTALRKELDSLQEQFVAMSEKAEKFDTLQRALWDTALHGNVLQSTMAAALIRSFDLPSPEGDDPESA